MSKVHVDFRIKLLSGNNVVLVEANGYESEIFVPQIINGRICFNNIIPNRRCCYGIRESLAKMSKKSLLTNTSGQIQKTSSSVQKALSHKSSPSTPPQSGITKPIAGMNSKVLRMVAGSTDAVPKATSTPVIKTKMHTIGKENLYNEQSRSSILTPDVVRHSVPYEVPSPYEVIKDTISKIPSGIQVVRLYSTSGNQISRKSNSRTTRANSTGCGDMSSFRSPTRNILRRNSTVTAPTLSSLRKQVTPIKIPTLRKMAPIRTYSRTGSKHNISRSPRKSRPSKYLPTYLHNPTQGTKGSHKIELRRRRSRKIIIDSKTKIPIAGYSKQLRIKRGESANGYQFRVPKTKKAYARGKYSAFDLLTTSNYDRTMAKCLKGQFRRNCVNKASSTHPKYKNLSTLPPLELDPQTVHLLSKTKDINFPSR